MYLIFASIWGKRYSRDDTVKEDVIPIENLLTSWRRGRRSRYRNRENPLRRDGEQEQIDFSQLEIETLLGFEDDKENKTKSISREEADGKKKTAITEGKKLEEEQEEMKGWNRFLGFFARESFRFRDLGIFVFVLLPTKDKWFSKNNSINLSIVNTWCKMRQRKSLLQHSITAYKLTVWIFAQY